MRDLILWKHERGTWQYDIFCLLIVAFIFLTPKAWFDKGERFATQIAVLAVKGEHAPNRGEREGAYLYEERK